MDSPMIGSSSTRPILVRSCNCTKTSLIRSQGYDELHHGAPCRQAGSGEATAETCGQPGSRPETKASGEPRDLRDDIARCAGSYRFDGRTRQSGPIVADQDL